MEVIVLAWVLFLATMWLARILAEEAWAAIRGVESPRITRRRAREQLASECGTPTIGQALAYRVARRVANPPRRRWAAGLRALLDDVWDDALAEARVRHQYAHEARMRVQRTRQARRQAGMWSRPPRPDGWHARTGSDAPLPPDEDVVDTWPCPGCDVRQVFDPDELCDTCDPGPDPYPWPPPEPDSDPAVDDLSDIPSDNPAPQPEERKALTMTAATYSIDGDVIDPRTALRTATIMRGANNAIAAEMDILHNNMRQADLGPGLLADIASLADEQRIYAASNAESCRVYASHVLAQQDIYDDEDLRDTVHDTYLDMQGGDVVAPPAGQPVGVQISAVDCRTPEGGAWFTEQVARAYDGMKVSVDQMKGNLTSLGLDDEGIDFLNAQLGYATSIATKAAVLADRFRAHAAKIADTVGKNSLHGTQEGRYARAGG